MICSPACYHWTEQSPIIYFAPMMSNVVITKKERFDSNQPPRERKHKNNCKHSSYNFKTHLKGDNKLLNNIKIMTGMQNKWSTVCNATLWPKFNSSFADSKIGIFHY